MANPMRSTDFRAVVEPILNEVFDERKGIARTYHEEPVLYGMGAAPELPDGMPVTYQSGGVLFQQRYLYKVYGLAFALTKVLVEDGDHIRIGQTYAKHLAQSLVETKETLFEVQYANPGTAGTDSVQTSVGEQCDFALSASPYGSTATGRSTAYLGVIETTGTGQFQITGFANQITDSLTDAYVVATVRINEHTYKYPTASI